MASFDVRFLLSLILCATFHNVLPDEIPGRPPYPFASLNGSLIASATSLASGRFEVDGSICTDAFGAFPCSCLALSLTKQTSIGSQYFSTQYATEAQYHEGTGTAESVTGTTVVTIGGEDIHTDTGPVISSPPDDCCESCEIDSSGVHIIFWPVEDSNTTLHNASDANLKVPYTMVSDGFTFTSPSVYVAYDNLQASTECFRLGYYSAEGKAYNTTIAYNADELSTSQCFLGNYKQINYTQLQYPPPNSMLTDCYHPDQEELSDYYNNPKASSSSPIFSYPPGINSLVSSWKRCTVSQLGAFDPPRTLNKATAMAPIISSSTPAAPASPILPVQISATPTPTPKDPKGDAPNQALSSSNPKEPNPSSDPKVDPGPGSPQNSQQPGSQTNPPNINDPPKTVVNNNPSDSDPLTSNPSSNGSPDDNTIPADSSPKTDLPINGESINKDKSSSNAPSSSAPNSDEGDPSSGPSYNDGSSVANPIQIGSQTSSQVQGIQVQVSSTAAQHDADSGQGLGGQIYSALGFVAGSAAVPETIVPNPPTSMTNLQSQGIGPVVSGWSTQLKVDGSSIQKDSNGAVIVAGQTVAQGSQATIAGVPISFGNSDIVLDNSAHVSLPSITEAPKAFNIGGYPVQQQPNGDFALAGQTFTPGAKATIAGSVVSFQSDHAEIDGVTYNFTSSSPTPIPVVVNGILTTLQASSPIISVAGQELSLGQASPYTNAAGQTTSTQIDGQRSPYIIAGQTFTPGGNAITVSGIPISLPAGQVSTVNLPVMVITDSGTQNARPIPVTLGGQVFTPNPSAFVVDGKTISAGAPGATVAGTVVSLQPDGSGLVVGSSTLSLGSSQKSTGEAVSTNISGSKTSSGALSTGNASSVNSGNNSGLSSTTLSVQSKSGASVTWVNGVKWRGSILLCIVSHLVFGGLLGGDW